MVRSSMVNGIPDVLHDGVAAEDALVEVNPGIYSIDVLLIIQDDAQGHIAELLDPGDHAVQRDELLVVEDFDVESVIHFPAFGLVDIADNDLRVTLEQSLDLLLELIPRC